MEKKLQKPYLTDYKLLIAQDLLLSLFNNFIEGIHRIKCKYVHDNKKHETWLWLK